MAALSRPGTFYGVKLGVRVLCAAASALAITVMVWRGSMLASPLTRKTNGMVRRPMGGTLRKLRTAVKSRVVGLGSCGVDFLAQVSEYPSPDDKIRTTDFQVFGGGNAANTLCALGKLGVRPRLITKIGTDSNGDLIVNEAENSNVDCTFVLRSSETPSPFTYVIVDQQTSTRTCIHTPATEELTPQEMHEGMLEGCGWLHLDGRHTEAAITLAQMANEKGIPVSLDAEKDRPFLDELITKADYLFTNSKYPFIYAEKHQGQEQKSTEDAMRTVLESLPRLKAVVTTMGAEGSVAVMREDTQNALRCPAWPIDSKTIADSTGAGDAFIAGCLHCLSRQKDLQDAMSLGSFVAARKLLKLGARAGVPSLREVQEETAVAELLV